MKTYRIWTVLLSSGCAVLACVSTPQRDVASTATQPGADPEITAFIGRIRAVDNHSHVNSVAPGDKDADALPLDGIAPFELPAPLRPDNPDWLAAYKALQDFLFRFIAGEAGRLGMAVHIHSFEGAGNFFATAGVDPLLLEPAFNDPALRKTNFVIIHGGGVHAGHTGAMLWKPNVYADISLMTLAYAPASLGDVLRDWLTQYPEKVLFGSDASAFGPDMGWELAAWIATKTGRAALALALTHMIRDGEVSHARAQEIATMVMRTNAARLYRLALK